jgi:hypothetical protein
LISAGLNIKLPNSITKLKTNIYMNKQILLLLIVLAGLAQFACKKDNGDSGTPTITNVRLIDSTKRDSSLSAALTGTVIVIQGHNLGGVQAVYFNDSAAYFNPTYTTSTNIIVAIPADAPTSVTDPNVPNQIKVVTNHGEATFSFTLLLPPPTITGVSNENALPGSTTTITGTYLYLEKIIFPGNVETTDFTVNDDKTQVTVTVPASVATSGPLTLQGAFGSSSTPYPFDSYLAPSTGFLANFESGSPYFGWQWWGGINSSDASAFPNNTGSYIEVHPSSTIIPGDNSWWSDNRAVLVAEMPWVAEADMSNSISNYALKFEIYVKAPWTNGSLMIGPKIGDNFPYMARYAPWESVSDGKFVTNGWTTVTIPLTAFLTLKNGAYDPNGSPAANFAALTGGSNKTNLQIMLYNDSTKPITSFDAAVDNVRIVKVQ